MTWRPEGWKKNPYPQRTIFADGYDPSEWQNPAFEAGADAMLEALKAEASFKAGQETRPGPASQGLIFYDGWKAGIKEVVDWLKTKHRDEGGIELLLCWTGLVVEDAEWQTKLKEWQV